MLEPRHGRPSLPAVRDLQLASTWAVLRRRSTVAFSQHRCGVDDVDMVVVVIVVVDLDGDGDVDRDGESLSAACGA